MPEVISFSGLVIVMAVAFGAPLLLGLFPRVPLPSVVLEIVAGIVIGPSVLGWVRMDLPVEVLSVVGLGFLLFVSGLEVELDQLRGRVLRLPALGVLVSLAIAAAVGFGLQAAGQVSAPLLIAIALTTTSLGVVVPVLKDAGEADGEFGQLVIASSTIADLGTVVLLTLFFSGEGTSAGGTVVLLAVFVALVAVVGLSLAGLGRVMRLRTELMALADTTAQIRIRGTVLLMLGFVALAGRFGLETILGAFLAGVMLGRIDRRGTKDHPHFRVKLEGIAYGFLIPVFFVTSGVQFNLKALFSDASTLLLVPILLLALLIARGVPALMYRPIIGSTKSLAAGLLQATSLPIIVTAAMIGTSLGVIDDGVAAALVAAGLLSVLVFPLLALAILRRGADAMSVSSVASVPALS